LIDGSFSNIIQRSVFIPLKLMFQRDVSAGRFPESEPMEAAADLFLIIAGDGL
jgi:hypothetical protein